jgi:hypothetical protein
MSKLRGVSILGGTVSISGTNAVSLGTDALADIKALRATEILERDDLNHFRVHDPITNNSIVELSEEIKDLNKTIKIIHNMEI